MARADLEPLGRRADKRLDRFQPYWAARAHLLAQSGASLEAERAYARVISLTVSTPARNVLESARAGLKQV